ncbi:DUF3040 domain-containing protein [Kocuria sp. cx-455]|uniref:DUF3040 domain-containing protein n=1 Tax=unclassified Candidatus Sulfotelmatobacter TaxID=2635724 RepID=UPI001681ECFF|nr:MULTISPECIES: DUF3040 domain-containing protein [unclassified Candidatus Sulfotelmatobacter]MBD2763387.1 DUF3040 domain-containing protein [Kocuria sp. cx-116]MBD2765611.1 DUF3040 domain-containing protein [Kocuria sp. cx-455]
MPLSEHEQQLLAQLEKQLHQDDPRFASTMQPEPTRGRGSKRNVVLGVVIAVVGLGVVLAGVVANLIILGVLGFIIMGVGVYVAFIPAGGSLGSSTSAGPKRGGSTKSSSGFLRNLEQKWDQRNQGGEN